MDWLNGLADTFDRERLDAVPAADGGLSIPECSDWMSELVYQLGYIAERPVTIAVSTVFSTSR